MNYIKMFESFFDIKDGKLYCRVSNMYNWAKNRNFEDITDKEISKINSIFKSNLQIKKKGEASEYYGNDVFEIPTPFMLYKYTDNWYSIAFVYGSLKSGEKLPSLIFDGIQGMKEFVESEDYKNCMKDMYNYPY